MNTVVECDGLCRPEHHDTSCPYFLEQEDRKMARLAYDEPCSDEESTSGYPSSPVDSRPVRGKQEGRA